MIRFVYFDAGGTLIAPYPSVGEIYMAAGRAHGLDAKAHELEAAFRRAWAKHVLAYGDAPIRMGRDDDSTRTWWRTLVESVFEEVEFRGDRAACFGAFFDAFGTSAAWRVFDDVLPVLDALAARGIRAGILSNWDYRLPHILTMVRLAERFDPVLVSALEGIAKPNRALFERACERVGCRAEEIAYVGDSPALDLEPALALGMRAFLIDRPGTSGSPHAVRSLEEMIPRLIKD